MKFTATIALVATAASAAHLGQTTYSWQMPGYETATVEERIADQERLIYRLEYRRDSIQRYLNHINEDIAEEEVKLQTMLEEAGFI